MKVCVVQPRYYFEYENIDKAFSDFLALIDQCDEDLDIIVLPEYSDILAASENRYQFFGAAEKYNEIIIDKAIKTAIRCNAIVFVNALHKTETGYRNTTYAIDRQGKIVGRYYKAHPAPSEVKMKPLDTKRFDADYSYHFEPPYTLEIEGIKFAFMTCYDFYFYENFPQIAKQNVDIIIGCALQRTDTHEALDIINRFLCYNTNAYLVRASVSLGEDSEKCGSSCVITPFGEVLVNMKSQIGLGKAEIDINKKHLKPAGFGGALKPHHEYIEVGRRPWLYRNAGASVVPNDETMKYPRLCAHRGFSTVAPENTMPAFGAAVAMGAEEIEFDIWSTTDGVLVSCHDDKLHRVSDGEGKIYEKAFDELKALDFGGKHDERFKGLKIATFEDILQKFAGRVIMNIHVKIWDYNLPDDKLEDIVALIRKYDCEKHCYFMTTNDEMIKKAQKYAPEIKCCVGWDGNKDPMSMVDRAIALGAYKIQLFKPYFNAETVKKAHENGILCNVFFADDPAEAVEYREMGIDTVLTNDYLTVKNALEKKGLL